MSGLNDYRGSVIEVGRRNNATEEPREQPEINQKEVEELNALAEQQVEEELALEATPWDQLDPSDCYSQEAAPFVTPQQDNEGAQLALIDEHDGPFPYPTPWEVGPNSPLSPESPDSPIGESHELEISHSDREAKLENFSNLADKLKEIEDRHLEPGHSYSGALEEARGELIVAIQSFNYSRFKLGRSLHSYRAELKADQGWMEAVKAVAFAMRLNDRTVRNIVSDYERLATALPAAVVEAAELRGIDLGRKKYMPAVKTIEAMIPQDGTVDKDQAARIVNDVIPFKPASTPAKPRPSLDEFANRTVKLFEKRYNGTSPEVRDAEVRYIFELVNSTLRSPVRELRQYGRPALVPKPATNAGDIEWA